MTRPWSDIRGGAPAKVRLSISIPADLAAFARADAKRRGVSISAVVAGSIGDLRVEQLRRELIEGLLEDRLMHQRMAR